MEKTATKQMGWLRRHYHWVIVAVVFTYYFVIAGLHNNIYSMYTIPVSETLEVSRSAFSMASTIGSIPAFFANLIFAFFFNRFGYRKMCVTALLSMGAIYFLYSVTDTVFTFYYGAVLLALMGVFYNTAAISRIIPAWFHRHKGLILGIVLAASGIGSSVASLMISELITRFGWRISYRVTAFLFFTMGILVLVTIRNQPENMGLRPLGADDETQKEQKKRGRNIQEWQGIPLKTLKKRPYFYLTIAGMFLAAFMTYAIYPTIVSHMQDNGMTQTEAAQVQSIMFLLLSGAKIFEGWLSDRIGARRVMVFSVICGIVAALILADVRTQAGAFAGVAVLSFVLTVSTIMVPVLTADVFGSIGYGSVLGIMLAVIRLATGTATTVANAYFDLTGSYHGMYLICAGMGVTALLLFMAAFRGAEKERAKVSAEQAE